jgi:heme/copper-type cytochrome/quinol oxidase subunit 2
MPIHVRAVSKAEFANWVAAKKKSASANGDSAVRVVQAAPAR